MSDPTTTPKQLTQQEYDALVGRQCAFELLMGQAWVCLFLCVQDEAREFFVQEALIELERRWQLISPNAQRVALLTMEDLLNHALATARSLPPLAPPPKDVNS